MRDHQFFRHFALQSKLRNSKGKVNISWLTKNAGTSTEQLERFYLKNMTQSAEQVDNLQKSGDEDLSCFTCENGVVVRSKSQQRASGGICKLRKRFKAEIQKQRRVGEKAQITDFCGKN